MISNPLLDPAARLVIAHRGNRVAVAENTLESLVQAAELGADAVEFDVRMTRDGLPVLMHDPTIDRTTNGRGLVRSYALDELRAFGVGAGRASAGDGARLRIPTLEEVFDRLRETPFVIEVKEMAAADATEQMIRRFGAKNRVVVGSSETSVMERFYRSGLSSCASSRDSLLLLPQALLGFKPLSPRYDLLSIPPRYRGFPLPVLRMASAVRRIGIATHVWTVNDPTEARAMWVGGVAGIVTDDPAALLRARAQ